MKTTSRAYQALGAPPEKSGAYPAKEESIGPVEANCAMLSLPGITAQQPPKCMETMLAITLPLHI
jgi:hypothetical protein